MAAAVNVREAQTDFSKLLSRVANGEEIIIAQAGRPLARLVPFGPGLTKRTPGSARGQVWIAPDFDDPLPDDLLDAFEGRGAQ